MCVFLWHSSTSLETKVRGVAAGQPEVIGLDKLHARKMGLSYYVDLHIVVDGQLSVRDGHRIAHVVEREILNALPQVSEVLVHGEPEEELAESRSTTKSDRKGEKTPRSEP